MMRMLLQTLILGAVGLGQDARAAGFQAKTMREPLSAREVERPLILGKGWLEFGLGSDLKLASGQWSPDGEVDPWAGSDDQQDTSWLYSTQRLAMRYGITRRGELYWTLRTHYVRLQNEPLQTDISQFGLGDPHFGYRYELYRSIAPVTSVIVYGDYKGPAANESPGNYVGGPYSFSRVILTTGTPDMQVGLRGKRQVGPLALELGVAYTYRLSQVVQYVVETESYQGSGRIKPGDLTQIDGGLTLQVGPVALQGGALFVLRQETRIGATAPGLFPAKNLVAVDASDGWSLDANAGATFNITRSVDIVGGVNIPVRGEDLLFFPIEDINPTYGLTYSGTVEFRY